ncbi:MAG: outer membrane beta-barrel protein [Burkholderiales bacterium]
MRILLVLMLVCATKSLAQSNEWSLNVFIVGSKNYEFEDGASARNDGGAGIGATIARNLNDYFAVGVDLSLSEFNYRARVVPGAGNAAAAFETSGSMETAALRLHATWNLLARPVTPFVTAGAGVIFLDTNLESDPPAGGCWIYPWYGQVCGATAPKTTLARLSYGAAAGVRFDLPRNQGFVRAMVGGEWIEIPEARSSVGYWQLRADFGIRF